MKRNRRARACAIQRNVFVLAVDVNFTSNNRIMVYRSGACTRTCTWTSAARSDSIGQSTPAMKTRSLNDDPLGVSLLLDVASISQLKAFPFNT